MRDGFSGAPPVVSRVGRWASWHSHSWLCVYAWVLSSDLASCTLKLSSRGSSPACLHAGERRGICFFLVLRVPHPTCPELRRVVFTCGSLRFLEVPQRLSARPSRMLSWQPRCYQIS